MTKRVLIVGGMAGGASCAARLRRVDERAEIVVIDRNPWISVASCGLPYFLGGVIRDEQALFVATPERLRVWLNIRVSTDSEALAIDRDRRTVRIRDLKSGTEYDESYDALVLSPGARPVEPFWPGADLPGVYSIRSLAEIRCMSAWIKARRPKSATVIGAGLIGLEMAENLAAHGLAVSILEKLPHIAPMLDPEMSEPLLRALEANRVDVSTGEQVTGFEAGADGALAAVNTTAGRQIPAGLAVVALGVRPEVRLARAAGLRIGPCGGIRVDDSMRTSDPSIWAVGDAVESMHVVTGQPCLVPQAGPATRQGRIAADAICGRPSTFRGAQGTVACMCFGVTAAVTGATETQLRAAGIAGYETVYLHPGNHAEYYPGSAPISMKVLFSKDEGRILGAQAVGGEGAEKRIDAIAIAIQKNGTVFDLEEAELCYAPQFGAARDPVNLAGMVAANVLRGDVPLAPWRDLERTGALILDVRDSHEFAADHMDDAVNIPIGDLRPRMQELPRDREIWVSCGVGQRAYFAVRALLQNGFRARTLSGGYRTWWGWNP